MTNRAAILDHPPAFGPDVKVPIAGAVRSGDRVFLSAANALQPDGSIRSLGDPAGQTEAALDQLEAAMAAVGGSLAGITKLTTCLVDRGDRAAVYGTIARRLNGVYPVSTGLVVAGLPKPGLLVQIDAEAVVPDGGPIVRHRKYETASWHGQGFAWQGSMVAAGGGEFFVRGQTGSDLEGGGLVAPGRRAEDAGVQADRALANLATVLAEAGSSLDDVAKITVYIGDRAYRQAVYPMIGRHFGKVRPVSTGIITTGFARPEILFEIDVVALARQGGEPHERLRTYHSDATRYGLESQRIGCEFCMAVRSGRRVILRGQTGGDLDGTMHGLGDAAAQARQAMDNVEMLLADAGATLANVVKATVYATDRAFLEPASRTVLERLSGVLPAFSGLVIKGLASPELLMEVDITAVLPEAGR